MGKIPRIDIEKIDEFFKYIDTIEKDEKYLKINGITYVNIYNSEFLKNNESYAVDFEEYFLGYDWDYVNVNNRDVVDIGSNVADTKLYFAKNGANVVGFEPVKHLYELGLENIELNKNLKDKIITFNKAVGVKKGKITIELDSIKNYVNTDDNYEIDVISIKEVLGILKENNMTPDVLKMDCEGCEFEIILNADLSMFNDIIFEHHSKMVGKDYNDLIYKLENDGFKVDKYQACNKKPFEEIGIIHAHKKQ